MKFRKKPVEIEARQFETNNDMGNLHMDLLIDWINENGNKGSHNNTDIFIKTLEGTMTAKVGDWIINGVENEFYPCKPNIFEKTYEPIN